MLESLQNDKIQLKKKVEALESLIEDSREEAAWKRQQQEFQRFVDFQVNALQDLRAASEYMKKELLENRRRHLKELSDLGVILNGLVADATQNYQQALAENRWLYNKMQELKGNIRVYCRIRPILPGQSTKEKTVNSIGELVISNPKQGRDSTWLFKFNKVFGPTATQEEVFSDTGPLIQSVFNGCNVCIFAYGPTGSGKTYTMSGSGASSREDWGVNYRALNDLFQIAQSRTDVSYEVVQMVEIYNEQVRDLLSNYGLHTRYPFHMVSF
ncbi:kinesin-like protein KIN-14J [Syzygium oleosum]|uniref:kinesin-like protein KIN-14J n=1 Tax=Syzygium oleosum TaxID=219896 RepID=UPI0024B913D9|nr:kinesin-like protein KIN-14J [Syzygium oleosum]